MSLVWTRSEPKKLRPFWAVAELEDALKDATVEPFRGAEPITEESKVLDAQKMHDLAPILRPHLDLAVLCAALGHRKSDFELVVTIRTPQMLRRTLFQRWPLDEELPEEIEIDPGHIAEARLSGQVEIAIALCCKGMTTEEPGWPTHPGAWLSRKTFSIGMDRRRAAFAFELLTEDEINIRKLSPNTAFVVDFEVELNVIAEEGQCLASVLVAEGLLEALRSGAIRSSGHSILQMEIMDSVLEAKAGDIDPNEAVEKGSLLERLLRWASDGKQPMSVQEFKAICSSPDRRRALCQHRIDLSKALQEIK